MLSFLSKLFGGDQASQYKVADIYSDLRNQALSVTTDQLNSPKDVKVYGFLMEMGFPEAVVTLVSMSDGAASLYFSNGGGIIGGGERPSPHSASNKLISEANRFSSLCQKATAYPLPRKEYTRFYLLTRDGVFTSEVLTDDLGNQKSDLSPLFYAGQDLITEIRKIDEQRQKTEQGAAANP